MVFQRFDCTFVLIMELTGIKKDILDYLEGTGRRLPWLAKKTGISYDTLYYTLKNQSAYFKQEKIDKINEVLGTNFRK